MKTLIWNPPRSFFIFHLRILHAFFGVFNVLFTSRAFLFTLNIEGGSVKCLRGKFTFHNTLYLSLIKGRTPNITDITKSTIVLISIFCVTRRYWSHVYLLTFSLTQVTHCYHWLYWCGPGDCIDVALVTRTRSLGISGPRLLAAWLRLLRPSGAQAVCPSPYRPPCPPTNMSATLSTSCYPSQPAVVSHIVNLHVQSPPPCWSPRGHLVNLHVHQHVIKLVGHLVNLNVHQQHNTTVGVRGRGSGRAAYKSGTNGPLDF